MVRATVKFGSRGSDVEYVQQSLNSLGFNAGSVDGIFGSNTQKAVMAFQNDKGLVADGIVGPNTYTALSSALSSKGVATVTSVSSSSIASNMMPVTSASSSPSKFSGVTAKIKEALKNPAIKFGVPTMLALGVFAFVMSKKQRSA